MVQVYFLGKTKTKNGATSKSDNPYPSIQFASFIFEISTHDVASKKEKYLETTTATGLGIIYSVGVVFGKSPNWT